MVKSKGKNSLITGIKNIFKNPLYLALFVLLILIIILYNFHISGINKGTFSANFDNSDKIIINNGADQNAAAVVFWNDTIQTTGWGCLNIVTNNNYPAEKQAYAAGYLEAYVSWERAYQYWYNYKAGEYGSAGFSQELVDYMNKQKKHVELMSKQNKHSTFWNGIGLVLSQFNGFAEGYHANAHSGKHLPTIELYMLNSVGDLEDLNDVFPNKEAKANNDHNIEKSYHKFVEDIENPWHSCSALIQVLDGGTDVAAGHTTWRSYYAMLRIYKVYNFSYAKRVMSISSSPGLLHSKDDFYALSNGLVIMETTNTVDSELYKNITPMCAMSWQRVMCANMKANIPQEWVELFKIENSGTYNNQWMALDTGAIKKLYPITKNTHAEGILWIAEQIPGYVETGDVTHVLFSQGYWPSYNVPYFKNIYNMSGYPKLLKHPKAYHKGEEYNYEECPRAKIFKRYQNGSKTFETVKQIMQYNDYLHDPLSDGNPSWTISSRYDLKKDDEGKRPFGGIDSKVTSANNVNETVYAEAISGPSRSHNLPTFNWSGFGDVTHIGVPSKFNFNWIKINSSNFAMN